VRLVPMAQHEVLRRGNGPMHMLNKKDADDTDPRADHLYRQQLIACIASRRCQSIIFRLSSGSGLQLRTFRLQPESCIDRRK
jgi:hypothetical protein